MNNEQFKNQHKVAIMILNRSWKKQKNNSDNSKTYKKKYISSPLKREIIFYKKRNLDQLHIDMNDFMRYKKKYHLVAF